MVKEQKLFKALAVGLLLWIVSALLKNALFLINFVFTGVYFIVAFKWKTGAAELAKWFFKNALANDQSGNVQSAAMFQLIFTKKGAEPFGNEDDTVSYVLARNYYKYKLTFAGRALGYILELIDKDHLTKSIESKIKSDREAAKRLQKGEINYFR